VSKAPFLRPVKTLSIEGNPTLKNYTVAASVNMYAEAGHSVSAQ